MKISREIGGNCRSSDFQGTKQASLREKYLKNTTRASKKLHQKNIKKFLSTAKKFVKKNLKEIILEVAEGKFVWKSRKS